MRHIGNNWGKDTAKLFVGLFSLMFFFAAYTGLALMASNALAAMGKTIGAGAAAGSLKITAANSIPAGTPTVAPISKLRGPGIGV